MLSYCNQLRTAQILNFHTLPLTLTGNVANKKTFPQVYKVMQVKTEE